MNLALLSDLNWLAVALAALTYFVVGGVWYTPRVFGNAWMRSLGWEPQGDEEFGPALYIAPAVTCVVTSIALAVLGRAAGAEGLADGVVLGLVAGVGIAGAVLLVTGYFDPKKPHPRTWFAVTAGHHLVGILIAAVIVSVWT